MGYSGAGGFCKDRVLANPSVGFADTFPCRDGFERTVFFRVGATEISPLRSKWCEGALPIFGGVVNTVVSVLGGLVGDLRCFYIFFCPFSHPLTCHFLVYL